MNLPQTIAPQAERPFTDEQIPIVESEIDNVLPIDHILEALCPHCNIVVDAACPRCGGNLETSGAGDYDKGCYEAETARRLMLILNRCSDVRFTLECYFMSVGAGFAAGVTMKEIARRFGKTKATVSKRCRELCRELGLRRSSYMRSEEASKTARMRNSRPKAILWKTTN